MGIKLASNFDIETNLPLDSRFVADDITARDAISAHKRFDGLVVYVKADNKMYQLQDGITNSDWASYTNSFWDRNSGVLTPETITDKVGVGSIDATTYQLEVGGDNANIVAKGGTGVGGGEYIGLFSGNDSIPWLGPTFSLPTLRTDSQGVNIVCDEHYCSYIGVDGSNAGNMLLFHENNTKVRLDSSGSSYLMGGNVGFDTTGPTYLVEAGGENANIVAKGGTGLTAGKYFGIFKGDTAHPLSGDDPTLKTDNEFMYFSANEKFSASLGSSVAGQTKFDLLDTQVGASAKIHFDTSGNSYVIGGRVGFGTTDPTDNVEIQGNLRGTTGLTIKSTDTGAFNRASVKLINSDGTNGFLLLKYSATHTTTPHLAMMLNQENGGLSLGTNNTHRFRITPEGQFALGRLTSPSTSFDLLSLNPSDQVARFMNTYADGTGVEINAGSGSAMALGVYNYNSSVEMLRVDVDALYSDLLKTPETEHSPSDGVIRCDPATGEIYSGTGGIIGDTGVQGSTGVQGVQGSTGVQGIQGSTGVQGIQGSTGVQGIQGSNGIQGSTGVQGIQGSTGVQGIQGSTGIQGIQGDIGVTGAGIQYWDRNSGVLSPTTITDKVAVGVITATSKLYVSQSAAEVCAFFGKTSDGDILQISGTDADVDDMLDINQTDILWASASSTGKTMIRLTNSTVASSYWNYIDSPYFKVRGDGRTDTGDLYVSGDRNGSVSAQVKNTNTGVANSAVINLVSSNNALGFSIGKYSAAEVTYPDGCFLWNYRNGDTRFGTNNLERLKIEAAGNILQSTSSTGGLTHTIKNTDTGAINSASLNIIVSNESNGTTLGSLSATHAVFPSSCYLWNYRNGVMRFGTNNLERLKIEAAGDILHSTSSTNHLTHTIKNTGTGIYSSSTIKIISSNDSDGFSLGKYSATHPTYANGCFLWNFKNGAMQFGTNATERLRIEAAGNILHSKDYNGNLVHTIKNTSTSSLNSSIIKLVTNNSSDGLIVGKRGEFFDYSEDSAIVWNESDGPINFGTNDTEVVRFTTGGRVGVGTQSPQYPADFYSDTDDISLINITSVKAATSGTVGFRLERLEPAGSYNGYWRMRLNVDTKNLSFDNGSDRFIITETGRVGVSVTSPAYPVDVLDTQTDYAMVNIVGTEAAGTAIVGYRLQRNESGGSYNAFWQMRMAPSTKDLSFTNGGTRLTIANDGDVFSTALTDYASTSTVTGWSSTTTKKIYYKKMGKQMTVYFQIEGTSNSSSTRITLPSNSSSLITRNAVCIQAEDNGSPTNASAYQVNSSNILYFSNSQSASGTALWTSSGTKKVVGQFVYEIA